MAIPILERCDAREAHSQLAVVKLEADFRENPGQRIDGLEGWCPCGVEGGRTVILKRIGDLPVFAFGEIPFRSPCGVAGFDSSPGIVG